MTEFIERINNIMITFANYFKSALTEAKFREIPEQITQQANKIADEYFEQTKSLTPAVIKQVKKIGLSSDWENYFEDEKGEIWFLADLTTVEFVDLTTNETVKYDVYIALGKDNENYAICDDENKVIIIYEFNTRNLDRDKFVSVMVHEITHGFQQHKKYSKKYEKMKANRKVPKTALDVQYYKEPVEIDAFMTEIAHTIRTEFQKIKNDIANSKFPETKKIMEKKLEKFLTELRIFINSPLETYFVHKELPLPYSFERFEELLTFIQKTPKLWRAFKLRMEDLYKKLTGEDIRGQSVQVEKPAN
jgi:hypothetical protein